MEQGRRGAGIRDEGVGIVAPVELRDIFVPTDREQHLLIDLLQRADCCLDDIAQELRTSVAALTIYLASDDAIEILAQAELANARRGRLAATAQLDKCTHALSLILDGYINDTTTAVRRDTPKTRREDLIHQESARRAATQLFKIANFTPRIFTATRLLAPLQRGEVPESSRAVRGRDATELQPASINTPPNSFHDGSSSPSPGGGSEGAGGVFSASKHSSPTPPTASPTTSPSRLLAPRQPDVGGEDSFAAGQTGARTLASDPPPSSITAPTSPSPSPPRTTPRPSQPQSQRSPAPPRQEPQLAAPASTAPP